MPRRPEALAALLARRRNDLTEAAIGLLPEIAVILQRLEELPGALLARMSGSGATCFALFVDRATAAAAGAALARSQPDWWVAAGALLPSVTPEPPFPA
jgi:4-diphosphocytidyl-2-C-methyl-D-erythritol kinase